MAPRLCFVPHPAGLLHVATLQTAVFTWTLSRHLGGDWVQATAHADLLAALGWLGLDWDEETAGELTAVSRHPTITHIIADPSWYPLAAQHNPAATWLFLPPLADALGQPLPSSGYLAHHFESKGYLPAALFNFLLRLSWQPASGQEIVSKWEARQQFAPTQMVAEPVFFDWARLDRMNQHYLAQLSDQQLAEQIRPFLEEAYDYLPAAASWLPQLASLLRPHLVTLEDAVELAEWAFTDEATGQKPNLPPDGRPILARLVAEIAAVVLLDEQTAVAILTAIQRTTPTPIAPIIEAALTGTIKHSPIPKILGIIGKQRALNKLAATIRHL